MELEWRWRRMGEGRGVTGAPHTSTRAHPFQLLCAVLFFVLLPPLTCSLGKGRNVPTFILFSSRECDGSEVGLKRLRVLFHLLFSPRFGFVIAFSATFLLLCSLWPVLAPARTSTFKWVIRINVNHEQETPVGLLLQVCLWLLKHNLDKNKTSMTDISLRAR